MPARGRAWSHDELLVVFRLYCRTPFGHVHSHNREIIELARTLDRTPGSIVMKVGNYASLDPHQQARGISGLTNVSRADRELWQEFLADSQAVAIAAEAAYAACTGLAEEHNLPELGILGDQPTAQPREGTSERPTPYGPTERDALVKTRRVQSFFRAAVLASYENKCALTGLALPELLNASHIVPWAKNEQRRADPRNGLCLNALHDRAFDRGLITFDEDMRMVVSPRIAEIQENKVQKEMLMDFRGRALALPKRFQPDAELMAYHRQKVFRG